MKSVSDTGRSDPRDRPDTWPDERHARTLRAWILAGLRFALTLDHADRLAVLACATELDRSGAQQADRPDFMFFRWSSGQLCAAIADRSLPSSAGILRQHLARINDEQLKRTFASAIGIDLQADTAKPVARLTKRGTDLWSGLGR